MPGGGGLARAEAEVGNPSARRRHHLRLAQVKLRRLQRRLRGTQLRVVSARRPQRLLGAAQVGLCRRHGRLARGDRGGRLVGLCRRGHTARHQFQRAFCLGATVGQHRLRLGDPGLRGGNVGSRCPDRLTDLREIGLGRLHRQPEGGRIDLEEQRAGLDDLVVADSDP